MQVCKTALPFQQCSHHILGGIKSGAGHPRLRERARWWGRLREGRETGAPEFLHSSPRTPSAKRAEAREGKPPFTFRQHPSTWLNHLTPSTECCFAAELPLHLWVQPQEHAFVLQEGFWSFSSPKPCCNWLSPALVQLSAGHCTCASFLCPLPFGIAGLVHSVLHQQPGHHLC